MVGCAALTDQATDTAIAAPAPSPRRLWRVAALIALLGGLFVVGLATGVTDDLTIESLRAWISDLGAPGVLLFIALFAAGQLVQMPGMLFVSSAALAYGQALGFVVALTGAMLSVAISFLIVRGVGGKALTTLENRWAKKALHQLDRRPFTTMLVLRLTLWTSPVLNYTLALTNVRFGPYMFTALLGASPAILGTVLLVDEIVS